MHAALPWQLSFQAPATPIMEGIIEFHNTIMLYLTFVGSLVCWLLYRCIQFFREEVSLSSDYSERFTHSTPLEIFWTIVPALILVLIAVPSFALLYSIDDVNNPTVTLKCVGHQWYWSYEYSDYNTVSDGAINYDSYMKVDDEEFYERVENSNGDLNLPTNIRLLSVDNCVMLPINNHIRILVTAADVLHSWAVPSFGVKVDACPGRLNQGSMYIEKVGHYYGQCSEICGVNHGFMPILVKAVNMDDYTKFIEGKLEG